MKNLTRTDVFFTAFELIKLNGQTTSLEVKNELRTQDFYAIQKDVSKFLYELGETNELQFTTNGLYRIYILSKPSTNVADLCQLGYTTKKGNKVLVITKAEASSGDVYAYAIDPSSGALHELYFAAGTYSRSIARYAFQKITGINYIHCRAKKIK